MRKILATIITIILCHFLQAQTFDWSAHEIKNDSDLLKATVHLFVKDNIQNPKGGNATGFFFYDINNKKLYLVTNQHVVKGMTILNIDLKGSTTSLNDKTIRFTIKDFQSFCKVFPVESRLNGENVESDLAIIDIEKAGLNVANYDIKMFTNKNIPNKTDIKNISVYSKLLCVSYPIGAPLYNCPYLLPCSLTMPLYVDYRAERKFCINGLIFQGCSGSPIVYKKDTHNFLLLGVDSLTITNDGENIFLSECPKSSRIIDLINQE